MSELAQFSAPCVCCDAPGAKRWCRFKLTEKTVEGYFCQDCIDERLD